MPKISKFPLFAYVDLYIHAFVHPVYVQPQRLSDRGPFLIIGSVAPQHSPVVLGPVHQPFLTFMFLLLLILWLAEINVRPMNTDIFQRYIAEFS